MKTGTKRLIKGLKARREYHAKYRGFDRKSFAKDLRQTRSHLGTKGAKWLRNSYKRFPKEFGK
jgi:hypothetical protein